MKEFVNFHGSDIERVAEHYKIDKDSIHNYSGNVNPRGLSPNLEQKLIDNIHLVTSYPDPDYKELKKSISAYTNCSEDHVLLGNGTTELIAHYIDYVEPEIGLIVGPTYSEYEKKMRTLDTDVRYFPLEEENDFRIDIPKLINVLEDSGSHGVNLLVLCNPNNPTATLTHYKDLYDLLDVCKSRDIFVLIDETYMDFVENWHDKTAFNLVKAYSNIMVLRGYSKFFAAPGLRLGYGISSDLNCHRFIAAKRHHWAINSMAAFAGEQLMKDEAFITDSREFIKSERVRVTEALSKLPHIKVFPTEANFFLIKLLKDSHSAHGLFEFLIKKGLMIRNITSFPFIHGEYIRFCLLCKEDNDRLLEELKLYLK